MKLLNERFKLIRKELGYTQEEFGNILGVKRCTIGAYDEGRASIPLELIPKLMELGNIPTNKMFDFIYSENYKIENE